MLNTGSWTEKEKSPHVPAIQFTHESDTFEARGFDSLTGKASLFSFDSNRKRHIYEGQPQTAKAQAEKKNEAIKRNSGIVMYVDDADVPTHATLHKPTENPENKRFIANVDQLPPYGSEPTMRYYKYTAIRTTEQRNKDAEKYLHPILLDSTWGCLSINQGLFSWGMLIENAIHTTGHALDVTGIMGPVGMGLALFIGLAYLLREIGAYHTTTGKYPNQHALLAIAGQALAITTEMLLINGGLFISMHVLFPLLMQTAAFVPYAPLAHLVLATAFALTVGLTHALFCYLRDSRMAMDMNQQLDSKIYAKQALRNFLSAFVSALLLYTAANLLLMWGTKHAIHFLEMAIVGSTLPAVGSYFMNKAFTWNTYTGKCESQADKKGEKVGGYALSESRDIGENSTSSVPHQAFFSTFLHVAEEQRPQIGNGDDNPAVTEEDRDFSLAKYSLERRWLTPTPP
ncbi:MAG: hypothetical protein DHS20C10_07670 [marine bacterium B5-7]|nr:MAG: hypothetical protein DHS20C10_07670 [marine bacterium B5-7]